jgi:hypothetical protein
MLGTSYLCQFVLIDHDISRLVVEVGERVIRLNVPLARGVVEGAEVVRLRQDRWQAEEPHPA